MAERESRAQRDSAPAAPAAGSPLQPEGHPGPDHRRHRVREGTLVGVVALSLAITSLLLAAQVNSAPPATQTVIPPELYEPVTIPLPSTAPAPDPNPDLEQAWLERPPPTPTPTPSPTASPRPKPRATPKPAPRPASLRTSRSIRGTASWYCRAGYSICHYKYPPGSMVAAACAPLRAAMGPSWRGQRVKVSGNGRSVVVRLVDYCASRDKTIDLYWEPLRRLGGTDVLSVKVAW